MGDLSLHFSRSEFKCHHCAAGCASPQLLTILEKLRAAAGGRPLIVVSGFRCVPHNVAVGGAQESRHLSGDAADLRTGLFRPETAASAGAIGMGIKDGWVTHVDWRPGAPTRWLY